MATTTISGLLMEAWKKVPPKEGDPKTKKNGELTFNWCIHHMAWTVHKPSDCKLGKKMAEEQKSSALAHSATVAASAAATINPHFAAMLATLGRDDSECRCAPAWIYDTILLVFMAGTATLDTGQYLTYLFLLLTPFIIQSLLLQVIPQDPLKLKIFVKVFSQVPPQLLQGHVRPTPHRRVKRYKKPVSRIPEGDVCKNGKVKRVLRTYLFPFAMVFFQVGCRVEIFLR